MNTTKASRIAVTGAHGYIGRHVLRHLCAQGFDVIAIDRSVRHSSFGEHCIRCDLLSGEKNLFTQWGRPDAVLHLAWDSGFNHNLPQHLDALPKHYEFCTQLIEDGCRSLTVMGTMHEIGCHVGAVTEDTPCSPSCIYGIVKNAMRQALELYTNPRDVSFKWLRGFYFTGDDEHNQSIFTKILQAAKRGEKTFPLNSGKNLYDFSDVGDAALQIAAAATQTKVNGIINICSGDATSLKEKVLQFVEENKLEIKIEFGKFPERIYDSPAIYGNTVKIKEIMGDGK